MHRIVALALLTTALASFAAAQEPPAVAKHNRWVTDLAFNGDGTVLATVGGESLPYRPGDVKLWDPKTGALLSEEKVGLRGSFYPAGRTISYATYASRIVYSLGQRR